MTDSPDHSSPRRAPKRSLGQNFLVDANVSTKIAAALQAAEGETVLEIGPGRGALTKQLLLRGIVPVVLELDRSLAVELKTATPSLNVVVGNGVDFPYAVLPRSGVTRVIGNLPYNVGSVIIWEFVRQTRDFSRAVFMVQREVAERIVAKPGSRTYGMLSAWVQSFVRPEILFHVSPNVFRPRPRVWSSVLAFIPRQEGLQHGCTPGELSALLKILFQKRRKQLGTILKDQVQNHGKDLLEDLNLERTLRPEDLTPESLQKLAKKLGSTRL
ncbi:MAG: 16S rRNA (adenine(1518)-N(6)/adenine(1519)-N(6))-dimethyltransferase RsmA [Desulfovibrionales bacterium]